MTEKELKDGLRSAKAKYLAQIGAYDRVTSLPNLAKADRDRMLVSIDRTQRLIGNLSGQLVNRIIGPKVQADVSVTRVYQKEV